MVLLGGTQHCKARKGESSPADRLFHASRRVQATWGFGTLLSNAGQQPRKRLAGDQYASELVASGTPGCSTRRQSPRSSCLYLHRKGKAHCQFGQSPCSRGRHPRPSPAYQVQPRLQGSVLVCLAGSADPEAVSWLCSRFDRTDCLTHPCCAGSASDLRSNGSEARERLCCSHLSKYDDPVSHEPIRMSGALSRNRALAQTMQGRCGLEILLPSACIVAAVPRSRTGYLDVPPQR
jgi:hypothetical protein